MNDRVLIVDDDPGMLRLLSGVLTKRYSIRTATSGEDAIEIHNKWCPDVVLLDLVMPGIDGFEVCRQIKADKKAASPQVIIVSVNSGAEDMHAAFAAGADDYFVKPVRACELLSRIQLHMRLREALISPHASSSLLSEDGSISNAETLKEVTATQDIAVFAMTKLAETRDNETGEHLFRLRDYSLRLSQELQTSPTLMSHITEEFLRDIYRASPLHDIGKVGIPDRILLNPGRLTASEFDVMKRHTIMGAGILEQAAHQSNAGSFLQMAIDVARWHHERWDGSGYPDGLSGEEIPLPARIVAVVDVYDALTSERPYKPSWESERAREYITERAGTQFDPEIANCFDRCFADIEAIQRKYTPVDAKRAPVVRPQLALVAAS